MTDRALNVLNLPITGTQLIEASAGTGKTYTISNLFVRLIIDTDCAVENILVLTFTKAATAELRDRIRSRLGQTLEALRTGTAPRGDEFMAQMLVHVSDPAEACRKLERARAGFDDAPIHTIHGFCQRVLAEHALSTGTALAAEILSDESELRTQIAHDFWRREICLAPRLLVEHLLRTNMSSPESMVSAIKRFLGKPYLRIVGGETESNCEDIEQAYRTAFHAATRSWLDGRAGVEAILLDSPALNRTTYKQANVPAWLMSIDAILADDVEPTIALPEAVGKCAHDFMATRINKGHECPDHPFFDRCETLVRRRAELSACHAEQTLWLRRQLIGYCESELARRKREADFQSYDDMLNGLAAALRGASADKLVKSVRAQYRAALVDEVQDTDPVQYEIYRRLYGDSDLPLYLVGDPKQAIYAFRGADVYAYIKARKDVAAAYLLTVNWRSDARLVEAVNTIFQSAPDPFLVDSIQFVAASATTAERPRFTMDGESDAPFNLRFLTRESADALMTKEEAGQRAIEATVAEIARLLASGGRGDARIAEVDGMLTPLRGGHLAVLVRTHAQGQQVKAALAARGIDSVELAEASVYDSDEAAELARVLRAVEMPSDERRVRAALATVMLGASGEELHALTREDAGWESVLLRFGDYHELWREQGFFVMTQRLIEQEMVSERLLAMKDGARRMTNLLHLTELLQAQASRARRGMRQLIDWLDEIRGERNGGDEESQLRLESDAELVQIVTVHRSKGLEFPIVFCPFAWDESTREPSRSDPVFYHDPANADAPTLHLDGAESTARAQAERESRAESLRLLYVALTRAKFRCYLLWGAVKAAARSAPAWLLHRHRHGFASDAEFSDWFDGAPDAELRADLQRLVESAPAAISMRDESSSVPVLPVVVAGDVKPRLSARSFSGHIVKPWRMLSYSGLVGSAAIDRPDHDDIVVNTAPEIAVEPTGIFAFPRGARAGSCLHAILERIDFSADDRAGWQVVVAAELQRHGFPMQWDGTLMQLLAELVATPLQANGLRLRDVHPAQRINEMEFHFPFSRFSSEELIQVLRPFDTHGVLCQQFAALKPDAMAGYMKGYIDLVFENAGKWYIVDYKSNLLGMTAADYAAGRMQQTMADESYGLQYLIYTVALHRYLGRRIPGYDYTRHVGGVFYLFLRGMSPRHVAGTGIFADLLSAELVTKLDHYLSGGRS